MLRFITQKIVSLGLVCILIVFAAHLGMRMVGNSESSKPDYDLVENSARAWKDTRAYLASALHGNFGTITTQKGEVSTASVLEETYINSMGLLLVALGLGAFLGILMGTSAALIKNRTLLFWVFGLTLIGISTPSFFAGLLLRQGEIWYLNTFGHSLVSVGGFGWNYKHMLLPVLVLAARPMAYLARASHLAVSRVMEEDYIRTAFSKGLTQARTVNVHAVRNIAIPVLTAIGVSLRFSLSALPVVEFLFFWPGMGLRLLEAINARQTVLVATLAAALGFTFLSLNLVLDVVYKVIDPRMREI